MSGFLPLSRDDSAGDVVLPREEWLSILEQEVSWKFGSCDWFYVGVMYRVSSSCTTASDCAAQLLTNRQSKIYFVKAPSQRISHSTKHKFLILSLYYAVPFCFLIPESSLFDLLETCTFTKFLQIFMNFFPKYLNTWNVFVTLYHMNFLHSTLISFIVINISLKLFWC